MAAITYPLNFHGYTDHSRIYCFDTDSAGNLLYGGETEDTGLTDNNNAGNGLRAFLVYQRYSDASVMWRKFYTLDTSPSPRTTRKRTSVTKFTKDPIVQYGNKQIAVVAYMPGAALDKIEIDFILADPFTLIGSW